MERSHQWYRGKFPNAQFLLLDDPNPKRRERYGTMVDALEARGVKISRADEEWIR